MKKLGIIDVGSNSTRLLIVELLSEKAFKIIDEVKEAVRLGKDIREDGSLNPERVKAALTTLRYFKNRCELYKVDEIIAVATAAVRVASDREVFLQQVKCEIGLDIRVLSGEEEAFYDYFGIINSIVFENGLMIDIGGASVEIAYIKDRQLKEAVSLPFGAITLTEKFGLQDEVREKDLLNLRAYLTEQYSMLPWLSEIEGGILIGVGGTVRNIGKICRKLNDYSLERAHNYEMPRGAVVQVANMVTGMNLKQRKKLKGLSKGRADIFPAACEAVKVLIEYCSIPKFVVSGHGVKEGLLYEYLQEGKIPVENILEFSLNNLIEQYHINKEIAGKVWSLAEELLSYADISSNIEKEAIEILKAAVMLYRIGIEIRYYGYTRHSFYMILNSNINGMSHRQILMTAYTVLYYQREDFSGAVYHYRDLLSDEDIQVTQKLGTILNKAINLITNDVVL